MADDREYRRDAIEQVLTWVSPLQDTLRYAHDSALAYMEGRAVRDNVKYQWNKRIWPKATPPDIPLHLVDFLPEDTRRFMHEIHNGFRKLQSLTLEGENNSEKQEAVTTHIEQLRHTIAELASYLSVAHRATFEGRFGWIGKPEVVIGIPIAIVGLVLAYLAVKYGYPAYIEWGIRRACGVPSLEAACNVNCPEAAGYCSGLVVEGPSPTFTLTVTGPHVSPPPFAAPTSTPIPEPSLPSMAAPTPTWIPCDSRSNPTLPCMWTILEYDYLHYMAGSIYGNYRFELALTNLNRDWQGYRTAMIPGLVVRLPEPSNIPPAYPACPVEDLELARLPCLYSAVSGDKYYDLAKSFYGEPSFWRCIAGANFLSNGYGLVKLATDRYEDLGGYDIIIPAQRIPCPE